MFYDMLDGQLNLFNDPEYTEAFKPLVADCVF